MAQVREVVDCRVSGQNLDIFTMAVVHLELEGARQRQDGRNRR